MWSEYYLVYILVPYSEMMTLIGSSFS